MTSASPERGSTPIGLVMGTGVEHLGGAALAAGTPERSPATGGAAQIENAARVCTVNRNHT